MIRLNLWKHDWLSSKVSIDVGSECSSEEASSKHTPESARFKLLKLELVDIEDSVVKIKDLNHFFLKLKFKILFSELTFHDWRFA